MPALAQSPLRVAAAVAVLATIPMARGVGGGAGGRIAAIVAGILVFSPDT